MPVYRYCTLPGPRRSRARVRVTFDAGTRPGAPEEKKALEEMFAWLGGSRLDELQRRAKEYMADRGWPVASGEFWCNDDGSRWVPAAPDDGRPEWATVWVAGHPAARARQGSSDRVAWDILYGCELVRQLMGGSASAAELVEQTARLFLIAGRVSFEARLGRVTDVGVDRLVTGRKAARKNGNLDLQERARRWCDEVNEAVARGILPAG